MKFHKYHALGNDYLVLTPPEGSPALSAEQIQRICHRNFGLGSDGLLLGKADPESGEFSLRIFNPDGSEAEKSGNGLRIFARYLWDQRLVQEGSFTILTAGGKVLATVREKGQKISVEMGQLRFASEAIPMLGRARDVLNEQMEVEGRTLRYCAATIGNPHCVILCESISAEEARHYGPLIENHEAFPQRTNVQFMVVLDDENIQIEIWERGAGYTLASGSSSSAAAAVAHRLGLCANHLWVHMPGGSIEVDISPQFQITISGPVTPIAQGSLAPQILSGKSCARNPVPPSVPPRE